MIGDGLKVEMHNLMDRLRSNVFSVKAANGTLTVEQVTHYLANVLRILHHTPVLFARAVARATEQGDTQLVKFFEHKAEEELGHEMWAERDLKRMTKVAPNSPMNIVPATDELIAMTLRVIDEQPVLILAYLYFNEALMVDVGGELIKNTAERCGVPKTSMTVVGNHVKIDREHADEILEEIDGLVGDPKMLPRMREVMRESADIVERFGAQLVAPISERAVTAA